MNVRASAELTFISHYANRFPGLNKTTNFFKDYRRMFVKGNDVAGMLNRDHVTCFSCKAGKNNYASQRGLNALVLFTGDINAVMPGTDIKMLGHHSPHRSEKSRSEEHTSELQSLMRISYAVFCLKKKKQHTTNHTA